MKYFDKLPLISYNGYMARNIMALAALSETTKNSKTAFYPYSMTDGERADVISHKYYDNSDYAWLIWMANGVIDPYYDMILDDDNFLAMIESKYGTIEAAQAKIMYYRNNWMNDNTELSEVAYNALPANIKKYYTVQLNSSLNVHNYIRKKKDMVSNTNAIATATVSGSTQLQVGSTIRTDTGSMEITSVDGNTLILQHLTGSFEENQKIKNTDLTITSYRLLSRVIPEDEYVYWAPVTAYDMELEANEEKRSIKLIDNKYKAKIKSELEKVFK